LRIDENDVRVMGRTAGGVRGIKLAEDDELLGLCPIFENGLIMMLTENGYGKRLEFDNFSQHHRGTGGQLYYKDKNNKGEVAAVLSILEGEDIFAISVKGQIIRISSDQISKQGRAASGIRLVRVSEDDKVIAASRAPAQPEENIQTDGEVSDANEPKIENVTPENENTQET
jgi:DNA gyrase subunit A